MIGNILRKSKRKILYGGFAEPVHRFLLGFKDDDELTKEFHKKGSYVVNLSFDLEFGLSTRFWENDLKKAVHYGSLARENLRPISEYLFSEKIPYNVQIVAALLENDALNELLLNNEQKGMVLKQAGLFALAERDIQMLKRGYAEIGLHGLSHRTFDGLSRNEAHNEMKRAQEIFSEKIGGKADFMSFPKNRVSHTDALISSGIKYWRSDVQSATVNSIPNGLWFSPGILDGHSLERVLKKIKKEREGYFLHLWGHYTEMKVETLAALVEVIRECGWNFRSVRGYIGGYE